MLVVHPTGAYKGQIVKGLVCLTSLKSPTHYLAPRGYLANQNGRKRRVNVFPALTVTNVEVRMARLSVTEIFDTAQIAAVAIDLHIAVDEGIHEGWAYFARRADGAIKVGFTKDLKQRRRTLKQVHGKDCEILATRTGGKAREGAYHFQFAEHYIGNEWFHPVAPILAEIDRLNGVSR